MNLPRFIVSYGRCVFLTVFTLVLSAMLSCESRTLVVGKFGQGGAGGGECAPLGEPCSQAGDCCSAYCQDDVCAVDAPSCLSDGDACEVDGECCSGSCVAERCQPLTTECFTRGNECENDDDCCSSLCSEGRCDATSSYCLQEFDQCAEAGDCCSGACVITEGQVWGTCAAPPSGASNCNDGVAGTVCDSCNDCCSRLCAPYGESGVSICALASGCRQTGELCATDAECCGGDASSNLPGAGNVTCDKRGGAELGICRNAMACSPQGNACHYQDYACSVSAASNRCCDSQEGEGQCVLDDQGIPRCSALGESCQEEGESCAMDGDCCDGACRVDDTGRLRCNAVAMCGQDSDRCTTGSDCCRGLVCRRVESESFGQCSPPTRNFSCALVGQDCERGLDCCGGTDCVQGSCEGGLSP